MIEGKQPSLTGPTGSSNGSTCRQPSVSEDDSLLTNAEAVQRSSGNSCSDIFFRSPLQRFHGQGRAGSVPFYNLRQLLRKFSITVESMPATRRLNSSSRSSV